MKKIILILAIACIGIPFLAQNLKRKNLKPKPLPAPVVNVKVDSLPSSCVRITGYDKPLRARYETMIATNTGTIPFDSLALTITYSDTHGNRLHVRSLNVAANLQPGQAKTITLKSWDVNNTYYYFITPPKRSIATPYKVLVDAVPFNTTKLP